MLHSELKMMVPESNDVSSTELLLPQTSKDRLTAPPSVAAPPAILSSRDRSIADYS